jgi:hypothetical protein
MGATVFKGLRNVTDFVGNQVAKLTFDEDYKKRRHSLKLQ